MHCSTGTSEVFVTDAFVTERSSFSSAEKLARMLRQMRHFDEQELQSRPSLEHSSEVLKNDPQMILLRNAERAATFDGLSVFCFLLHHHVEIILSQRAIDRLISLVQRICL